MWRNCLGNINYDIVGDIHSCYYELYELLKKLNYTWDNYRQIFYPPKSRKLIFVGDIFDRGPDPYSTYLLIKGMIKYGYAEMVRGNHCDKLMRWAKGNKVKQNNGLDKTILALKNNISKEEIFNFFKNIPYYLSLDNDKLIVVHAAWQTKMKSYDNFNKKCRTYALYGPTTGKTLFNGFPDRIDWVVKRKNNKNYPIVVYGHQPYKNPRIINKTYGIDGGCVFGGYLNCLKFPEMEII
jgi:protein phosphatase